MPHFLDPFEWTPHTLEVLTAIGTAGAVVVAVLGAAILWIGRWVNDFFKRPRLVVAFEPETDIGHEVALVETADARPEHYPAAFFRLRVTNTSGARAADAVEVIVAEVIPIQRWETVDPNEWTVEHVRSFGALGWANAGTSAVMLGPRVTRTVDLGWIIDQETDGRFHLGLSVQPLSGRQHLPAGNYKVYLDVVARNVNASRWSIELSHDGSWDDERSAAGHVSISPPKKIRRDE